MMRVDNRLRELRARYRMTQEELARRVGVTRQTSIAAENGKYLPSLKLAYKIARVFDVRIEDVFIFEEGGGDSNDQNPPSAWGGRGSSSLSRISPTGMVDDGEWLQVH